MSTFTVFVGRLSRSTRSRDLEDAFRRYGPMRRCELKTVGRGMAYGFIDYEDRRDAEDAIRHEHGRELLGCNIVVEWAKGEDFRRRGDYSRRSPRRSPSPRYGSRRSPSYGRGRRSRSRDRRRSPSPDYRRHRSRSRSRDRRRRSRSRDRRRRRSYSREPERRRSPSPARGDRRGESPSRERRRDDRSPGRGSDRCSLTPTALL